MQFTDWLAFLCVAVTIVVCSVVAEDLGDSGQLQADVEVIPENEAAPEDLFDRPHAEDDPVEPPPSDIEDEPPSAENAGDGPSWEDDGGDAGSDGR